MLTQRSFCLKKMFNANDLWSNQLECFTLEFVFGLG
jgi:hypothetical protein